MLNTQTFRVARDTGGDTMRPSPKRLTLLTILLALTATGTLVAGVLVAAVSFACGVLLALAHDRTIIGRRAP